jgi:hypothetical protein
MYFNFFKSNLCILFIFKSNLCILFIFQSHLCFLFSFQSNLCILFIFQSNLCILFIYKSAWDLWLGNPPLKNPLMTYSVVDEAQVTGLGYQGNLPSKPSLPDNLGTHTYTHSNWVHCIYTHLPVAGEYFFIKNRSEFW